MSAKPRSRAIALLLCALSGCSVHHGDFTVLSDTLFRLDHFDLSAADRARGVEGEDVIDIVMFVPLGSPSVEHAIRDALQKGRGDIMTDAEVTWRGWYIPFVWGRVGWYVTGDVVRTRSQP